MEPEARDLGRVRRCEQLTGNHHHSQRVYLLLFIILLTLLFAR